MGSGFQFIDIILFAMIAAFLILRLRGVLGRRDGHEGGYHDPFDTETAEERSEDNLVKLPDGSTETSKESESSNVSPEKPENLGPEEEIQFLSASHLQLCL